MSYAETQQAALEPHTAFSDGPGDALPGMPSRSRLEVRAEWLVLGSVLLAACGQLAIKLGLNRHAGLALSFGKAHLSWIVLVGLFIYGMGTVLWIQAVAKRDISYVYPLSALTYTLVALGGSVLLGESFGWERWTGIAVMSLGVALLVGSRDEVRR